ncbi:hypothetical protein L202_06413 [Cryptococcus amylolentus CBS 6039]|uniref:Cwf19-like C-terminal domain-containing protein n=1 Tax=Cryptococcus amylolentus CBS 6039 TaxID=1295533 RepID=A0A1E3HHI4_9TREE|nr:hypothetical protein L202_06413 [Cryptococcus amylolentus CBS 6039]ODN75216.1 hypothetical protein L202_06413 [Cryptococcus amylolentus CBS 6039]
MGRETSPGRHSSRPREREHRSRHDDKEHRSRHGDREHRDKHRKHRDETEEDRRERKRHRKEEKRRDRNDDGLEVQDDDPSMWVEKSIDGTEAVSNIPTADSLPLKSHISTSDAPLPPSTVSGSAARERDSWMLEPTGSAVSAPRDSREVPQSADFFESMGTEHLRKDSKADQPDPSKLAVHAKYELNKQLLDGKSVDDYETKETKVQFGGPGSQWRMMKLRRLYEQSEEQGKPVEEIALERYGSLQDFNEALEERKYLDDKEERRISRRGPGGPATPTGGFSGARTPDTGKRFMFANPASGDESFGSRPSSRAGFRKPGEDHGQTPNGRIDLLRRENSGGGTPGARPGASGITSSMAMSTPVPSVFTPTALTRSSTLPDTGSPARDPTASKPPLSTEQLNKLQAAVLRAKLMDDPDAEKMEHEYELERERSEAAANGGLWSGASDGGVQGQMGRMDEKGRRIEVQVLPTLDGRGQLYDVGTGQAAEAELGPGNKKKKVDKFETRDKQGNLLRYNADDDSQSLGELVRQERFGAGSKDQKDIDAEMARAIATDGKFEDDLDYMDDNAEKLARRKLKSDALKRAFAINDYARTKKALDTCPFCYQDDRPPQTAIVALGTRTYLCCTETEELVPGHCLIVPLQHHLSMLEMEDDDWEEVRNFMKCLMRMHADNNQGVIFFETITTFKQQKHSYIEALPVPARHFGNLPAYFRESILASEGEWTQHKKLIDFSTRPGGFRRMMVPNIPYFMVQWDYKGEKGYGHVIEGVKESGSGGGGGEDEEGEGDIGGAGKEDEFPKYFAQEIVGNILGLEPRKWRKPQRIAVGANKERARALGTKFQPYNWTVGNTV